MKQLIITLLLIVTVAMHTLFSEADPQTATVWDYCGQTGQYTNGSAFQRNLNKVLESLVDKVYSSGGGYNASLIQGNDSAVYGLMQCRGDLDSSNCKQCALAAKTKLVQDCHNTSGFIQLDGCFLHYDNHLFYNDTQKGDDPTENIFCSNGNSSQPEQFINAAKALLSNITSKAEQSSEFFAAGSVAGPSSMDRHIYSIGQCWRDDLSPRTSCGACLAFAFSNIFESCQIGALAAQFGSRYCYLRSEIYGFFNTSILAPGESRLSPPVSGKKAELVILPTVANPKLIFEYDILREATSNFKAENKLGEGGFGTVFRGTLPDGREVAVKRLCIGSKQGDAEFLNEANLISQVQHRNLVKLLGCSVESSERLLVYEYLQNSSLDKILFDATKCHLLQWKERYEIIVGTARGLAYLHEDLEIRIIHRDIKVSNLLLDNKLRPKIADFGLARLFSEDLSHVSTRVAGTLGYVAPEYALRGQLTEKADVFSFGVLVLEIISGRKNHSCSQDMDFLIEGAWRLYTSGSVLEIMDPTLEQGSYSQEEGIRVTKIGLLCTQAAAALRPSTSRVVLMLTSEQEHLPSPTSPAFIDLDSVGAPNILSGTRVVTPHNPDPFSSILEPR